MNDSRSGSDELAGRAAADPEAFGDLYSAFQARIYSYVARRIPNRADAEDVTGQVFLKALSGIRSFDPGRASFATWLYRIAHNSVIDYYRSEGDARATDLDEAAGLYRFDSQESRDYTEMYLKVLALMRGLRPGYQEVLGLRLIEGMSNQEIASVLGAGERYTAMKISRALKALRAKTEEAGILESLG